MDQIECGVSEGCCCISLGGMGELEGMVEGGRRVRKGQGVITGWAVGG